MPLIALEVLSLCFCHIQSTLRKYNLFPAVKYLRLEKHWTMRFKIKIPYSNGVCSFSLQLKFWALLSLSFVLPVLRGTGSVVQLQIWSINRGSIPINVDKTNLVITTGKRLESKLDFKPSAKFSDHELVSDISCATLLDIDSYLSFSQHVDKICKNLSQRIALLRKVRVYLPLKQRLLYYNSIIHPIITYASIIWSYCDKESLNRVLKLQKRVARVILSVDRDLPSVQLFNNLKWIPFYEESKISCCSLIFKLI